MFRRSLALAITVLWSTAALAAGGTMVSLPSGSETIAGYLAAPEGPGKKPAIVVIHEWWGLNDWIKSKADDFARQGYVALAVDLYRGKVATDPDTAHQLMRGVPEDRAIRDMRSAVAWLRARPDVDGAKVASIGWCWGGGMSLDLAVAEPTMAGAVIYYGHLMTDPKTIESLKVPLLGNFGADDQGIPPESVREFEALAKKDGKSVDFKIYPGAGHGFASGKDPKNPGAAMDADARAAGFLAKVLKGSGGKG